MVVVGNLCGCGCRQVAPWSVDRRPASARSRPATFCVGHRADGIPSDSVRSMVEGSGVPLYELARRMGYDESPRRRRDGAAWLRRKIDGQRVPRGVAVRIVAAVGADPLDVDL
jgi:hypothetical protein